MQQLIDFSANPFVKVMTVILVISFSFYVYKLSKFLLKIGKNTRFGLLLFFYIPLVALALFLVSSVVFKFIAGFLGGVLFFIMACAFMGDPIEGLDWSKESGKLGISLFVLVFVSFCVFFGVKAVTG